MGVASGAATAYTFGVSEFTPGFWRGLCYSIFSFKGTKMYVLSIVFCPFPFGHGVVCSSSIYEL